jgi:hypothetical protein
VREKVKKIFMRFLKLTTRVNMNQGVIEWGFKSRISNEVQINAM